MYHQQQRFATALLLALAAGTTAAVAAHHSATTGISVAANVQSDCRINTTALNFGSYDPLVRNRNEADTRDSTQTVYCTKGATPLISIDGMSELLQEGTPAGAALQYSASLFESDPPPGPSPSDATSIVYILRGTLPAGQDAPVGSYRGAVTLMVNF